MSSIKYMKMIAAYASVINAILIKQIARFMFFLFRLGILFSALTQLWACMPNKHFRSNFCSCQYFIVVHKLLLSL